MSGFARGIQKATSTGATVTITAPTGPITNFEVAASSGITALTGDVTATGPGSSAATLVDTANVQSIVGTNPSYKASGLTGATNASRYVGATASGAPVTGTFAVGDFVIDQTGKIFVCTVAGTSGTWVQIGGSGGSALLTQINGTTSGAIAAVVGDIVNTTAASTVTLPASPSVGQAVLVNRGNHTALITITANTGQTINGGASAGSVSMVAAGAAANRGQALFIAQSSTAWSVIALGTDLAQGLSNSGSASFGSTVTIANTLTANGSVVVNNAITHHRNPKTANYTTSATDDWVACTANTFTLTLGTTVALSNQEIRITNESIGVITVSPNGGGTIDGVASRTMTGQCGMTVLFDGTNWHTVGAFGEVT